MEGEARRKRKREIERREERAGECDKEFNNLTFLTGP